MDHLQINTIPSPPNEFFPVLSTATASPVVPFATITTTIISEGIYKLPPETLWRIFRATNSPKLVFIHLPRVCKKFNTIVLSRSANILANINLVSEEDEDPTNALLQSPDPARLFSSFVSVKINHPVSFFNPISRYDSTERKADEDTVVSVAGERVLKVHMNAITDNPEALVEYLRALLKRGVSGPHSKRLVRVVFGTVQVTGRRGAVPAEVLVSFMRAMRPLSVSLWWWDADLIKNLPIAITSLKLPNMRTDNHIQSRDIALLSSLGPSLKKLELFRPLPRQPWGLESSAFSSLSGFTELRELIVRSGRLIGPAEALTAVLSLVNLSVLELPWNLDARLSSRLICGLPNLTRLQYVHVSSPDFFQVFPTYYHNSFDVMNAAPGAVRGIVAPNVVHLSYIGLNYMEPDSGDFAVMVEGLIRTFPCLKELTIRINNRPNEGHYDFFLIPREYLERCLRRLERWTRMTSVLIELGVRMWGSRRNYVDDLVATFSNSRMKVRVHSPVARIGFE